MSATPMRAVSRAGVAPVARPGVVPPPQGDRPFVVNVGMR
jgi:hypothetical protein